MNQNELSETDHRRQRDQGRPAAAVQERREDFHTTFDVGVSDGKHKTAYFPLVMFGKEGKVAKKYVTKGRYVLVEGRVLVNDKGYFNVVADWVQFSPETTAAKEEKPTQ